MAEPQPGIQGEAISEDLSADRWLGGRLVLAQPRRGHRVGTDAALLAAAAGAPEGLIADVGAGVGAVGLALAQRSPHARVDLIEIDPESARLAADNAARNGLAGRARAIAVDALSPRGRRAAGLAEEAADCVVTNPPFFAAGTVRASPDPGRAQARVLSQDGGDATLADWIRACLALLRPGGRFAMIHRPEALGFILAAAENRLGALAILPVHPSAGARAHRLLVAGVKGSRAPLSIAPALILHGPDGRLTPEADAIHRGEALIEWVA